MSFPWLRRETAGVFVLYNCMTMRYNVDYKAALPEKTVAKVEEILKRLCILTDVRSFGKDGMACSARVRLIDGQLSSLDTGTNGKGMDGSYALASAYGELMERIENKMLLFTVKYASPDFVRNNPELSHLASFGLKFRYFPDEKNERLTEAELCEWGRRLLPASSLFGEMSDGQTYDMTFLPFYSVLGGNVVNLPYDLIRLAAGSTGLCAGNTPQEALLQGLNEIFERHVLQRIYLDAPVLPTVSAELFSDDEVGKRIANLEEATGWRVVIKDCSLGQGFPVLGLLIVDDAGGRYTFRLGADIHPEIALQRCFTEIFQGTDINESAFLPIDLSPDYDPSDGFRRNLLNGRGYFPNNIFIEKERLTEIWCDAPKPVGSIDGNFKSVIDWLETKKYDIFVRDNSFLDFPAYHVYISGLSDVDSRLYDVRRDIHPVPEHYQIKPEFRLCRLSEVEDAAFVEKYGNAEDSVLMLYDYSSAQSNFINRNLLLSMLSFRAAKYDDAAKYMCDFLRIMERGGKRMPSYYHCVRDYFALMHKKLPLEDIRSVLATLYTKAVAEDVLSDMKDRSSALANFRLPDCFNCSRCACRDKCAYSDILAIERRVQQMQLDTPIDQSRLSKHFALSKHPEGILS